jgi:prolyl-tRNA editing enzyme YbaK/EbsC (Cys-tRNA(Pro) deacylase)
MGLTAEVTEFSECTRTAAEAAAAVGTKVGQIAKSLVYAAAGTPNAVFAVSPRDLVRITEAEVVQVKEGVGIS